MRAAMSVARLVDAAHAIDANVNVAIAHMNTRRAPKRSATQPLAGMNTVSATRYAVIALLRCTGSTPRSRAMDGSAVATIVPSMFCMKSALATTAAVMRKFPWIFKRSMLSMEDGPSLAEASRFGCGMHSNPSTPGATTKIPAPTSAKIPPVPQAPETPPTTEGIHDLRMTRYGFLLLNDFSLIALSRRRRSVAHREHDRRPHACTNTS